MNNFESLLSLLREYIDFVNLQVGMYMDACAGFASNKVRIERQVMRVSKPIGIRTDATGEHVIMRASFEDPTSPDVIHQRIIRARDFIDQNSPSGSHEEQLSSAILVFLYAKWETEIRPTLAEIREITNKDVRSDLMGDLRHIRHVILHQKGILDEGTYKKLKMTKALFPSEGKLKFSYGAMHRIFVLVKQDIARLILEFTNQTRAPLNPEELRDIAIQTNPGMTGDEER